MNNKIICNKARCKSCGDILISFHRHDFVSCRCGSLSVDGGKDYRKRSFTHPDIYEELTVYETSDFQTIRASLYRGTYGRSGREPLHWTLLKDMSNEWIKNVINDNIEKQITEENTFYIKELEYRKENNIFIADKEEN